MVFSHRNPYLTTVPPWELYDLWKPMFLITLHMCHSGRSARQWSNVVQPQHSCAFRFRQPIAIPWSHELRDLYKNQVSPPPCSKLFPWSNVVQPQHSCVFRFRQRIAIPWSHELRDLYKNQVSPPPCSKLFPCFCHPVKIRCGTYLPLPNLAICNCFSLTKEACQIVSSPLILSRYSKYFHEVSMLRSFVVGCKIHLSGQLKKMPAHRLSYWTMDIHSKRQRNWKYFQFI